MGELERLLAPTGRAELWERHFPSKPERDRLLLALMAYGGLRRSKLLGLDWDSRSLAPVRRRAAGSGRSRSTPARAAHRRLLRGARAPRRAGALRRRTGSPRS